MDKSKDNMDIEQPDKSYYLIHFWEPTAPGFCSFARPYFGTLADIGQVMEQLRESEILQQSVAAWDAYCAGDKNVTHNIAFSDWPLITPVKLIRSRQFHLAERTWDHINTWKYPCPMRFTGADVTQLIVQHNGKYYLCFRAEVTDLSYALGFDDRWVRAKDTYFGNGFLMTMQEADDHIVLTNRLFELELLSDELAPVEERFLQAEDVDFTAFVDEIFGNG